MADATAIALGLWVYREEEGCAVNPAVKRIVVIIGGSGSLHLSGLARKRSVSHMVVALPCLVALAASPRTGG